MEAPNKQSGGVYDVPSGPVQFMEEVDYKMEDAE